MFQYADPRELRLRHQKPPLAQEASPTSRLAAQKIEPRRGRLQLVVLDVLKNASSGLTDEEGIEATGISPSTYRPRRVELVEAGRIVDSGQTRLTKAKRKATVWRAA